MVVERLRLNINKGHKSISNEMGYHKIGKTVKSALLKATVESRVVVGPSEVSKVLAKTPERSLFCLMATPQANDSATHMHEVLLEAFCYENDIYVIKVDCPFKLSRILGTIDAESCCLIRKSDQVEVESNPENLLVDYCEEFWNSPKQPVVQLPV